MRGVREAGVSDAVPESGPGPDASSASAGPDRSALVRDEMNPLARKRPHACGFPCALEVPVKLRILALLALAAFPAAASAEQARFRFTPSDANGAMAPVAIGPGGAAGELRRGFGGTPLPFAAVRPSHMVTFRHPYSGRNVTVPMRLPEGPPRLEHRTDGIRYNYGDYYVEARFLPDGAIDVVYNSGFLRPLRFD